MNENLIWIGEFRKKIVHLTVPAPFVTDLASVPRILTWLVPRYGRYTKAAVLHDYYCTYFKGEHIELLPTRSQVFEEETSEKDETETVELQDRSDADEIFRWTMAELGVRQFMRWFMWTAVSWATLSTSLWAKGKTRRALQWAGRATLAVAILAAVVLLCIGGASSFLDASFGWRWVRILVFAFIVWAFIAFSYLGAGYLAQGRWDRAAAYLLAFALSVIALPLVVPVAIILVFLLLVWLSLPREARTATAPPGAEPTPHQRRVAAVREG